MEDIFWITLGAVFFLSAGGLLGLCRVLMEKR